MDLFGTAGGLYTNWSNQEFAEEMASTQYQRATADMKAAGLNPMAVFGSGGGSPASAPGGQQTNPVTGSLGGSVKSVIDAKNALTSGEVLEGEAKLKEAQADQAQASARIENSNADVITKENTAYATALEQTPGQIAAIAKKYGDTYGIAGAGALLGYGLGQVSGGNASAAQVATPPKEPYRFKSFGAEGRWYPGDPWKARGEGKWDTNPMRTTHEKGPAK